MNMRRSRRRFRAGATDASASDASFIYFDYADLVMSCEAVSASIYDDFEDFSMANVVLRLRKRLQYSLCLISRPPPTQFWPALRSGISRDTFAPQG